MVEGWKEEKTDTKIKVSSVILKRNFLKLHFRRMNLEEDVKAS